jgi:hypothetical protein
MEPSKTRKDPIMAAPRKYPDELRARDAISKSASAFFAAELDRPLR